MTITPLPFFLMLLALLSALPACSKKTNEQKQAQYLELYKQGDAKDDAGQTAAALELYLKAKALAPSDPGIYFRIAVTAGKLRKRDVCLEAITNLIQLEPKAKQDTNLLALQASFISSNVPFALTTSEELAPDVALTLRTAEIALADATSALQETKLAVAQRIARSALRSIHPQLSRQDLPMSLWKAVGRLALLAENDYFAALAFDGLAKSRSIANIEALDISAKLNRPSVNALLPELNANRRAFLNAIPIFVNSLGMEFVAVPGTEVLMCRTEVRFKDFEKFSLAPSSVNYGRDENHPVSAVSWNNAIEFCNRLTKIERDMGMLNGEESYSLPTDQEWSRAAGIVWEDGETPEARYTGKTAGLSPLFHFMIQSNHLERIGNLLDQSAKDKLDEKSQRGGMASWSDGFPFTAPVGTFQPNRYGIFDLIGNVAEYCIDRYGIGDQRITLRGGSFQEGTNYLSAKERFSGERTSGYAAAGFRLVLAFQRDADLPNARQTLRNVWAGAAGLVLSNAPNGLIVIETLTNGPAALVGIREGDRITHISGLPVRTTEEFRAIVFDTKPGIEIPLNTVRDRVTNSVKITVGDFKRLFTKEWFTPPAARPASP
jgi:hypothetical protein